MPNSTEQKLNIIWLALLAVPAASAIYSCLNVNESKVSIPAGAAAALLLFVVLGFFITKYKEYKPKPFFEKSFLPMLMVYVLCVIGYWSGGLSLTALAFPIVVYFFFSYSDRLQKWAQDKGNSKAE